MVEERNFLANNKNALNGKSEEGLTSKHTSLRFVELFAGIGLVRLGLSRAGWQCVFANDIDPKKAEIYRKNFGDEELVVGDIRDLSSNAVPHAHLITASFPCQDLSLAGSRRGLDGERSGLVNEALRIIEEKAREGNPINLVLFENVEGFLSSANGGDLARVLTRLSAIGYGVDLLLIDGAFFVPQSRKRVFIIGRWSAQLLNSSNPFSHPFRPKQVKRAVDLNPHVNWSFLDLPPILPRREGGLDDIIDNDVEPGFWFFGERLSKELSRIKGPSREKLLAALAMAKKEGRPVRLTGYRRVRNGETRLELRDDGIAGCLRVPTGGSSRQLLIEARPDGSVGVRFMTPREYARLQGVDDFFWIPSNERQALKGFGDAVVVPVMEWLGALLAREALAMIPALQNEADLKTLVVNSQ
ncbi:DNA cytosine methyltransferase [Thermus brockianus]